MIDKTEREQARFTTFLHPETCFKNTDNVERES